MIYIALLYSLIFIAGLILLQFFPRYTVNAKVYKYGLIILIIMFSYIAYRYIPQTSNDLYRYYNIINRMRDKPVVEALLTSGYVHEPFSNLLFLCVSKMTNNNAIYQTIGIVFIYGTFFFNIRKTTDFVMKKEENLYFITFFSFTMLLFSISGTRNTLAALFFSTGLYSEAEYITKRSWFFYFLAVCTHVGLLPIVILRVLATWLPKKVVPFLHIILIFWSVIVRALLEFMSNISNTYISIIVRKLRIYMLNENVQRFGNKYITVMFFLCILLALIYFAESKNGGIYIKFMGCLIALTIGCLFSSVLFERYVRVVCMCMLPMFVGLRNEKWAIKKLIMFAIVALDIVVFTFQVWTFVTHLNEWFA